jgi:enolase-phosphatase E1
VIGAPDRVRFVLLDIEGTTTPVDFVHRVLFPDARERVEAFLAAHHGEPDVASDVAGLRDEHARDTAAGRTPPAWQDSPAAAAAYARWLIDQDRKLTALKSLQGRIWAEGYAAGRLRGPVYDDVPRALARWTAAGRRVAIFSSGSVLAQKLIFGHSDRGDLTRWLHAYFDTTTGAKGDPESYRRIAASLGEEPAVGLFVSDVVAELDAARAAGYATALAVRPPPGPEPNGHRAIASFDELM